MDTDRIKQLDEESRVAIHTSLDSKWLINTLLKIMEIRNCDKATALKILKEDFEWDHQKYWETIQYFVFTFLWAVYSSIS